MKILILSSKIPYPPKDGGAIATLNLALGLAKTGCELSMLSLNTDKHFFPIEALPKNITEQISISATPIDTRIRPVRLLLNFLFSSSPYIAERFYDTAFNELIIQTLQQKDFNIVQLEGPYMSLYLPSIRKYSKAKISLRAHNSEHEIWERSAENETNPVKRFYMKNLAKRIKRMEAKLMEEADALVAISDRDAKKLNSFHDSTPCITVPAGIELDKYPSEKKQESASVFFIGSLDWAPNQEGINWLIDSVLPIVIDKIPDLKIHIAGRNASKVLMKKMEHASIIFHGEIEDAIEYISAHEIMIAPLLSGSGIRIKILEGMAMGKCVLTSTIGAEGIPVREGKEILIADNEKDFAEGLIRLISDARLRETLSKNSRKLISEKFDTFTVASRLEEFYKKLI